MKTLNYLLALLFTTVLVSCGNEKKGTDAEVSEAKEVEEVTSASTYMIDTENSEVTWIGSKPTGKHNGNIPVASGSVAVEDGNIVGGTVTLSISDIHSEDLAADEESQAKLEGHLKSADFFDAENHPTAEFVITSVAPYSSADSIKVKEEFETANKPASAKEHMVASPTHKVTGNLTMRGKTFSIAFPAHVSVTDDAITAKAKFNIDRTKWGLSYGDEATAVDKAKDKFIYNTVNVGFNITATKNM